MASDASKRPASAFDELGLKDTVKMLKDEIKTLYLEDQVPWVIGYSGGKDSTAVLQLVWMAIQELPTYQREKPVHVISTDTLVENPIVAAWVTQSLQKMKDAAQDQDLPIQPHRLTPEVKDTFWVNLIGRGYPAPRHKFRWCTERLKIQPSNRFIMDVVKSNGEAILVLGTRKAESSVRSHRMTQQEKHRMRDRLSPNSSLPNCLIYSPAEDWSNDDVWLFLMQVRNPWGYNNKDLLTMYQGASPDGECPLVVDTTTPSCGNSRFGCWVCTLVDKDKSMSAMIQNDEEKEWMEPLLLLRNELDFRGDDKQKIEKQRRDFRRMSGNVQLFHDAALHGPYTQPARENWVRRVLEAQMEVRAAGPPEVANIELITMEELHEIRRIWVVDKHEIEDNLPGIYEEIIGEPFPGDHIDSNRVFGSEEMELLKELCQIDGQDLDNTLHYEMTRELLDIEQGYQTKVRRSGLFDALEKTIRKGFYEGKNDAEERIRTRQNALEAAKKEHRIGLRDPHIKEIEMVKETPPKYKTTDQLSLLQSNTDDKTSEQT
jgi:DNA sulfur modification protein DndC